MTILERRAELLHKEFTDVDLNRYDIPEDFFWKNLLEAGIKREMKFNGSTLVDALSDLEDKFDKYLPQLERELEKTTR